MKLTQLKQIIKEEITKLQLKEQAPSNWDGNCGNVIPNNSIDELKNLCMKCSDPQGGSYDQGLNPSPCDCNLEGFPSLMDFCRHKFPNLDLGLGSNTSGGSTNTGTGVTPQDTAWATKFTTTVKKIRNPEKRKRFLDGRIRGWEKKLAKAGPKYKKQLGHRIRVAKELLATR